MLSGGLARLEIDTPLKLQAALSDVGLGVSPQTCWNWMNDKGGIDRAHMPAVAKLLGVTLADVVLAAADVPADGDAQAAS